jgi:hypothetical protein
MSIHDFTPQTAVVASKSYSAPLSLTGSYCRIVAWTRRFHATYARVLAISGAILAILLAWTFIACIYYPVVFGLFGIFMFPFRLHRRAQRQALHLQQVQLATMQAALGHKLAKK